MGQATQVGSVGRQKRIKIKVRFHPRIMLKSQQKSEVEEKSEIEDKTTRKG